MNNTIVTVDQVKQQPSRFVFCHIPKWAWFAEIDFRGNVIKWRKLA